MSRHGLLLRSALFGFALIIGGGTSAALAADTAPVFSTSNSMADNLRALKGKRVTVYTQIGAPLTGVVGSVGDHLLHLEQLAGKEYFDALISIDGIIAVETRARG